MRLGGPIFIKADTPESWAAAVAAAGYRAACCPAAAHIRNVADQEGIAL